MKQTKKNKQKIKHQQSHKAIKSSCRKSKLSVNVLQFTQLARIWLIFQVSSIKNDQNYIWTHAGMGAYPHFRATMLFSSKRAPAQLGVFCSLGSPISHQKISTSSSMETVTFNLMKLVTSQVFFQVIKNMQEPQNGQHKLRSNFAIFFHHNNHCRFRSQCPNFLISEPPN